MLCGTLILSTIAPATTLPVLLVGYALVGCGLGLVNAPITNAAVSALPADRSGVAGAITSTFRQVGVSLGVALLGSRTFAGFAANLPSRLAALPASARAGVLHAAHRASGTGNLAHLIESTAPRTGHAIASAFTAGLHVAYLVGAGLSVAAVLVGLTASRAALPAP